MDVWSQPVGSIAVTHQDPFVLSPSDLTFLWDECKRCFWQKVVRKVRRPSAPMPAIFNRIDARMKAYYRPQNTTVIGLPSGRFAYADAWVESRPLWVSTRYGTIVPVKFRGKIDTGLLFDDGTGGICDFKTSFPKAPHVQFYSRQLHAYALSMEHAVAGKLAMTNVSRLGLLVFEPAAFTHRASFGQGLEADLSGALQWLDIPRDNEGFFAFMQQLVSVLAGAEPPASEACPYCAYRENRLPMRI